MLLRRTTPGEASCPRFHCLGRKQNLMNLETNIVGGQLTNLEIGPTFVTLIGFSTEPGRPLKWFIRLEKSFMIVDGDGNHELDVNNQVFNGSAALIKLLSKEVVDIQLALDRFSLGFLGGERVMLDWPQGEFGCVQIDVSTNGFEEEPELIFSAALPDDYEVVT